MAISLLKHLNGHPLGTTTTLVGHWLMYTAIFTVDPRPLFGQTAHGSRGDFGEMAELYLFGRALALQQFFSEMRWLKYTDGIGLKHSQNKFGGTTRSI